MDTRIEYIATFASMRIPIREQLGVLVLFTSLLALAVISISTWVNNYQFVVGIK